MPQKVDVNVSIFLRIFALCIKFCVDFIAFREQGLCVFLTESQEVVRASGIKTDFQFYTA